MFTNHTFRKYRRDAEDSNQGLSAYQPSALTARPSWLIIPLKTVHKPHFLKSKEEPKWNASNARLPTSYALPFRPYRLTGTPHKAAQKPFKE